MAATSLPESRTVLPGVSSSRISVRAADTEICSKEETSCRAISRLSGAFPALHDCVAVESARPHCDGASIATEPGKRKASICIGLCAGVARASLYLDIRRRDHGSSGIVYGALNAKLLRPGCHGRKDEDEKGSKMANGASKHGRVQRGSSYQRNDIEARDGNHIGRISFPEKRA